MSTVGVILISEMLTCEMGMLLNQGSMVESLELHAENHQERYE